MRTDVQNEQYIWLFCHDEIPQICLSHVILFLSVEYLVGLVKQMCFFSLPLPHLHPSRGLFSGSQIFLFQRLKS